MRSSIPGVILFSINFFPRTAIATHGRLHAVGRTRQPELAVVRGNHPYSVAALRERSVQINPCNYGGGSGRRDIYRVFFQMIFFKMWNYSWRNGILINGGLIEARREITSLDHVCVARFIYFSVFKIRSLD